MRCHVPCDCQTGDASREHIKLEAHPFFPRVHPLPGLPGSPSVPQCWPSRAVARVGRTARAPRTGGRRRWRGRGRSDRRQRWIAAPPAALPPCLVASSPARESTRESMRPCPDRTTRHPGHARRDLPSRQSHLPRTQHGEEGQREGEHANGGQKVQHLPSAEDVARDRMVVAEPPRRSVRHARSTPRTGH